MASDEAWNAGWNLGAGYAGQRFAQKQDRANELWEGRRQEFDDAISGLQKKYSLAQTADEKSNTMYALRQAILAKNAFLNPEKGPGLGEKIGKALHLTKKPQEQSFTTQTGGIGTPAAPLSQSASDDARLAVPAGEPANPVLRQRPGVVPVADAGVPITLPEEPAYQQNAQVTRQPATAGAAATSTTPTMTMTPGAKEPGIEATTLPALPTAAPALPSQTQTIKRPAYSPKQLRDMAQRSQQAQEETSLLTSSAPNAPLSEEQQAVQTAHAQSAGVWATLQDTLDAVAKFFPPEDREKPREAVLGKAFGTAEKKPVLKPLPGSKPYKKPDGVYYQSMLNSLTGEITAEPMPEGYMPPEGKPLPPGPQYFAAKKKEVMGLPLTPDEKAALSAFPEFVNENSTIPRVAGYVAGARARSDLQNEIVENPENPMQNILSTAAQARRNKYVLPSGEEHQLNIAVHKGLVPKNFGTNLASLHTAEEHLRMASALVDTLNTGSFTPFNPVVLAWARLNGQPAPANFRVVVTSLAGEMANAFKGTGATDPEIEQIRKMINESDGPQALKSALNYSHKTLEVRRRNLWAQAKMAGINIPGMTEGAPRTGGASAPGGSASEMIWMRLPDGRKGQIHRSQKAKFAHDNPGATEVTSGR